ncbi:hypothetical protein OGAPHI_001952 [Ogataea philodendri]|uniref:RBR-type E3 ubiquitin transferase n=1 Tax=Ogataea philodendri TaxID=1378263 RepID=A0A9P8P9I4_9ASCO|nr:uncharacterized protein OGAPHI_001952 [Ogataea philodendri]KAH3668198.1 hypothetical protein OGAPHI_001952 [Ogataea philodendri]
MIPPRMVTSLTTNCQNESLFSSITILIGSKSYWKKIPGTYLPDDSVRESEYWLVSISSPSLRYNVGTTLIWYLNEWIFSLVDLMVISSGLSRNGKNSPYENSEIACVKLSACIGVCVLSLYPYPLPVIWNSPLTLFTGMAPYIRHAGAPSSRCSPFIWKAAGTDLSRTCSSSGESIISSVSDISMDIVTRHGHDQIQIDDQIFSNHLVHCELMVDASIDISSDFHPNKKEKKHVCDNRGFKFEKKVPKTVINIFMLDEDEELESLKAIFPEIQLDRTSRSGKLFIPVELESDLEIRLSNMAESQTISFLSPIELRFSLPRDYPHDKPPNLEIFGAEWLEPFQKDSLVADLIGIWEDFHDIVLFSIIDYLKEHSQRAFGIFDLAKPLILEKDQYEQFIKLNVHEKQKQFNLQTFECEICQESKKGDSVQRLDGCGHVFCNHCLTEYFTSNIQRGELDNVHCPSFQCTKAYVETNNRLSANVTVKDLGKFETEFFVLPVTQEFLNKVVDPVLTQRYFKLATVYKFEKYKRLFPFRVAQCPRRHCATYFLRKDDNDMLCVCPNCGMAFCYGCLHSWHGELNNCKNYLGQKIPIEDIELWLENDPDSEVRNNLAFKYGRKAIMLSVDEHVSDSLFEDLIESGEAGIVRCPSCSLLIQRSDGCNKMTCSRCRTYFCNLCGEFLSKTDPYLHYNDPSNGCFRRLFDGLVQDS